MIKGFVYLLMSVSDANEFTYKIGITKNNPELRTKQLQTGNSNKISLIRSYETVNYLKVERWLHRQHGMTKTEAKNEWRKLSDEAVFSFIDDCKAADDNIKFLLDNNSLFE